MAIQITAVGGYSDIGRNCTAIKIDNEVVILDMGLHLEHYIRYTENEDIVKVDVDELTKVGAIPNLEPIEDWQQQVKAIIPSHAHLDHVGAIPFLSNRFHAPLIGTPFTTAVIKTIVEEEKLQLRNPIKTVHPNSKYKVSDAITVELVHITHSTPQTAVIALHTPYGIILYAVDFKFDRSPIVGKKTNLKRLEELGRHGVLALILDSTNANIAIKTPSEGVARQMLKDVLLGTKSKDNAIVVTTFSSHIARLKSIIECGKKLNRRILFLGRSLEKYTRASASSGVMDFKGIEIIRYSRHIKRKLKEVERHRNKFLVVVTGHQGEQTSILSKMLNRELHFNFRPDDHVIFSCKVIPTETNIRNREIIEEKLRQAKVRIFKDIHVSGHAAREDLRDMINIVKPKHIIPAHGTPLMLHAAIDLASEMGYMPNATIHLLKDGQRITLS